MRRTRILLAAAWVLLVLLFPWLVSCRSLPPRHGPFLRGVWVPRWDFKTREDVDRIMRNAADMGFDHVLFQVRGSADAFYRSELEPWSDALGGKDPGFDPLQEAVVQGHALGLKVHAWVNVAPGWRGVKPPISRRHVFYTHPEWFLTGRDGKRQPLKPNYYVSLNLCLPEVRAHITAVMEDIARRYDIDGIHLDYIRFLERKKGEDYPYDERTLSLYERETGLTPRVDPERWNSWRRGCVNKLVREIGAAARKVHPGLVLSAAIIKRMDYAKRELFQDARLWAEKGWVDAFYPMNYERSNNERFAAFCRETVELRRRGARVLEGIGSWLHGKNPSISVKQIRLARELGADGIAIFSYAALFPSAASPAGLPQKKEMAALREALKPVILGIEP